MMEKREAGILDKSILIQYTGLLEGQALKVKYGGAV